MVPWASLTGAGGTAEGVGVLKTAASVNKRGTASPHGLLPAAHPAGNSFFQRENPARGDVAGQAPSSTSPSSFLRTGSRGVVGNHSGLHNAPSAARGSSGGEKHPINSQPSCRASPVRGGSRGGGEPRGARGTQLISLDKRTSFFPGGHAGGSLKRKGERLQLVSGCVSVSFPAGRASTPLSVLAASAARVAAAHFTEVGQFAVLAAGTQAGSRDPPCGDAGHIARV